MKACYIFASKFEFQIQIHKVCSRLVQPTLPKCPNSISRYDCLILTERLQAKKARRKKKTKCSREAFIRYLQWSIKHSTKNIPLFNQTLRSSQGSKTNYTCEQDTLVPQCIKPKQENCTCHMVLLPLVFKAMVCLNAASIARIVHVISNKQQTTTRKSNQLPLQRPKRKDLSTLLQQAKDPQSVNITVGKQGVPVLLQQLLVAHSKNDLIHLECKNQKQKMA